MRLTSLFLLAAFAASTVGAASYQKRDGTIVDPIQSVNGGDLPYTGNNLEPSANLSNASLPFADLTGANMSDTILHGANLSNANLGGADLSGASLWGADVHYADLSGANLTYLDLFNTNLTDSDLSGADLTNAYYLGASNGSPYYDAETDFTDAWYDGTGGSILFDPVAAGWTLVPEPSTALLLAIGLVGLTGRRRSH